MKRIILIFLFFITISVFSIENDSLEQSFKFLQLKISENGFFNKGLKDELDLFYNKSYELNDSNAIFWANQVLANYYYVRSNKDSSLIYAREALKIAKKNTNEEGVFLASMIISNIYYDMNENEKSLEILQELNKTKIINKKYKSGVLSNIGVRYHKMKNFEKALKYYKLSLTIKEEINDYSAISLLYNNIGLVYQEKNEMNKAIEYFNKSLKINLEQHDSLGIIYNYLYLGDSYQKINNNNKAEEYLLKSEDICIKINSVNQQLTVIKQLAKFYEETGSMEKAVPYLNKYISIKDSLKNEKYYSETSKYLVEFETVEKEEEILKKEYEINRKNKLLWSLIIGFIINSILMIIIFLQRNKLKSSNKELVKQIINSTNKNVELNKVNTQIKKETNIKPEPLNTSYSELAQAIIKLFEEDKIYRNKDVSLTMIATQLNSNKNYVSKAINDEFNKSYNVFLHEYRINESIELLLNPEFKNYTIQYISEYVGYKSISVFNTAFKKINKVTPSYFIRTIKTEK